MTGQSKLAQLQIRVSEAEKAAIRRAADGAGMDMSTYVLSRVLPASRQALQQALLELSAATRPSLILADINALLSKLTATELRDAVELRPEAELPPFLANYVAAMIELASHIRGIQPPAWLRRIPPLTEPVFGSSLESLRLHLLTSSPAPFRRRNIFIDASIGGRV
jgi:uncharacterized protein (DUF1778 family)